MADAAVIVLCAVVAVQTVALAGVCALLASTALKFARTRLPQTIVVREAARPGEPAVVYGGETAPAPGVATVADADDIHRREDAPTEDDVRETLREFSQRVRYRSASDAPVNGHGGHTS